MIAPGQLLSDEQRLDWLCLSRAQNVGPVLFYQLINRFGGARAAIEALPELSRRAGRKTPLKLYPRANAERDFARARKLGARFVARGEAGYPPLLRHIPGPPPLICIKGRAGLADLPLFAIAGSRNASALGMKFTRQVAREVGAAGYGIVSGLARGIDTAAHEASIDTGTIAVMAGGIDHIYPRENARLFAAIAERGLIVTEMTPGTPPRARYFPRRNRLVSGMSLGVFIAEAAFRSGSLITARLAGEQGREVFAMPGSPLDPRAAGTNRLIRDGAALVSNAGDILGVLNELAARALPEAQAFPDDAEIMEPADMMQDSSGLAPQEPAPGLHERIIALLSPAPAPLDDIIRESGAAAGQVISALMELELAGRITREADGSIRLAAS